MSVFILPHFNHVLCDAKNTLICLYFKNSYSSVKRKCRCHLLHEILLDNTVLNEELFRTQKYLFTLTVVVIMQCHYCYYTASYQSSSTTKLGLVYLELQNLAEFLINRMSSLKVEIINIGKIIY